MAESNSQKPTSGKSIESKRILHTMLRVGDMKKSIDFYTRILGMSVLRTLDQPDEKYTLTFLGYGDEKNCCVIELTYNYGVSQYEVGAGFGHVAVSVEDCKQSCENIRAQGGIITLEAVPLKGTNEVIAFVLDPDGYQIELIQR